MTDADNIRDFALKTFITPARSAQLPHVTFVAADIHKALKLPNSYPHVCSSIDAKIFEKLCRVRLIKREGPQQSSTVRWTFSV